MLTEEVVFTIQITALLLQIFMTKTENLILGYNPIKCLARVGFPPPLGEDITIKLFKFDILIVEK